MKRFTSVVLMLCIAMMCTTPYEAQSQNRRTGGGTSGNSTKKETVQTKGQNTTTSSSTPRRTGSTGSSSITTNTNTSRSSEPRTKMVTPSGQTQKQQNTAPAKKQNNAPAQVQDRRTQGTSMNNSRSHSAEISRKNSDVGRQNIPADRNVRKNEANRDKGKGDIGKAPKPKNDKYGDPMYNHRSHKPAAVQYHHSLPPKRGPEYVRPYLEPKHRPMPSYRYGDHFFGHRINVLPRGYVVMRIGGIDYYYIDGVYYRRYLLGGYYVCRPPRGTTIASTLFNVALTAIAINTIRDEIARAQRAAILSTRYGNVNANNGYVVRTSDDYYNTNLVNQAGQDYYYQDGVFYILKNGQYYVIEPPIGALVTEIPADYDEIVLEGRTYYQVEDTLYKATVIDGALYFEVVCNL